LKKTLWLGAMLTIGGVACYLFVVHAAPSEVRQGDAAAQTREVAKAANTFLNGLSADQRQKVMFSFNPPKTAAIARFHRTSDGDVASGAPAVGTQGQPPNGHPSGDHPMGPPPNGGKPLGPGGPGLGMGPPGGFVGEQYGLAVWSNYPMSDVLRPGLRVGSLSGAQRNAVMYLLHTMLSPAGYQKVLDIMASDQALSESGQPFCSGTACYTVAIFAQPSDATPWMIEFEGHHLGLNVVLAGAKGVMTPTLTEAQPSVFLRSGKPMRVLAAENDKAFVLLEALTEEQKSRPF
jgi:hypothetical protein